ncbi:MAG TPA: UvrD-helicase domain-containing protein, partial [Verrucomicrobiae bacterium]|nr:UvrD-helicase domain-containing protein [Verrucomicrobiae bacterium]
RGLVQRLHAHSQTLPHANAWLEDQITAWRAPKPEHWKQWLSTGLIFWRDLWLPMLEEPARANANLTLCQNLLRKISPSASSAENGELLQQVADLADTSRWPHGTAGKFRDPHKILFAEAAFLRDFTKPAASVDPLEEDWCWTQAGMITLLELTREFGAAFARAKRELAAVDFQDLEQFSLRLLWTNDQPSAVAAQWRERLELVFVDEYQDINAAQDRILAALSREGGEANRFLVGDVKQSIYRFRLADPRIFLDYKQRWSAAPLDGQVISLSENFRSREGILDCLNAVFSKLMQPEVGGIAYGEAERLRFGAPAERAEWSVAASSEPCVEWLLRVTGGEEGNSDEEEEGNAADELSDAEREARLVAARLLELWNSRAEIHDEETRLRRPVEWRDMVVLLRSPRGRAEAYAKEFARLGVPLATMRGGFYGALEVTNLVSLLHLLDNPLQDIPLLAVLRSPLVGLTLDELALVRLALPKGRYWLALQRFVHSAGSPAGAETAAQCARDKLANFLKSYRAWRELARRGSLSHCLETVLDQTNYEDWLAGQTRGGQRRANVERLLSLARQFDRLQGQGLFRFLRLIRAEQEAGIDPEPASVDSANAVRLMSIHQSKGLEFPVVVVAGLGKRFNLADLTSEIILDESYGLCPLVKPPQTEARYPSLPWWLAARRQRAELLGEEVRLLYVAFTRARDFLVLAGVAPQKAVEKKWPEAATKAVTPASLLKANSYLDWLGPMIGSLTGKTEWWHFPRGTGFLLNWRLVRAEPEKAAPTPPTPDAVPTTDPAVQLDALRARVEWKYEHPGAALEPAKTSVSALRRRIAEENDDEAKPLFAFNIRRAQVPPGEGGPAKSGLSATDTGIAHHKFLQHVSLETIAGGGPLRTEAERLVKESLLAPEEAGALDFTALETFWKSRLGGRILAEAPNVRRELPFTARFTPAELAGLGAAPGVNPLADEFVVVQGVVDLAILRARDIVVVDFKTDQLRPKELSDRVATYTPQLQLYALALERTCRRPVSESWLHFLRLGKSVLLKGRKPN